MESTASDTLPTHQESSLAGAESGEPECLGCFPEGFVLGREGETSALGQFQVGSIVGATLVKPGLIQNLAEHLVEPINIDGGREPLQIAQVS